MISFFNRKKKVDPVNILIIDDDPLLLELLKEFGSPSSAINLIYCSNAIDAVKIVNTQIIHGIFSDVNMRNMDYLDNFLLKKTADIPIYRFSGDCPHHLNIRLVKPFHIDEYLNALQELAGLAKIVKNAA